MRIGKCDDTFVFAEDGDPEGILLGKLRLKMMKADNAGVDFVPPDLRRGRSPSDRSGFGGSGTSTWIFKGITFREVRQANGKGFHGTDLNLYRVKEQEGLSMTASGKNTLIKLAASLPVGDDRRRKILAGIVEPNRFHMLSARFKDGGFSEEADMVDKALHKYIFAKDNLQGTMQDLLRISGTKNFGAILQREILEARDSV